MELADKEPSNFNTVRHWNMEESVMIKTISLNLLNFNSWSFEKLYNF